MDTLQILYAVFFGITIAVFIICHYIIKRSREESANHAYTAAVLLISLGIAYLALCNAPIDEETKNQFVYIGRVLAFLGLILTVQGDIKETQRHREIQDNIDQTHDRLDRIEECLKNITDQKMNDTPKISKEMQKDTDNSTSNIENRGKNNIKDSRNARFKRAELCVSGIIIFGIILWVLDASTYQNLKPMLEWGYPTFIVGVSIYLVLLQFKKQLDDSDNLMARLSVLEQKLDTSLENKKANQQGFISQLAHFIFPFWR